MRCFTRLTNAFRKKLETYRRRGRPPIK